MKTLKYVIHDDCIPVVFTQCNKHEDFGKRSKVTSAGFCQISVGKTGKIEVYCYGKSISLNVESDPESDSFILEKMFNDE